MKMHGMPALSPKSSSTLSPKSVAVSPPLSPEPPRDRKQIQTSQSVSAYLPLPHHRLPRHFRNALPLPHHSPRPQNHMPNMRSPSRLIWVSRKTSALSGVNKGDRAPSSSSFTLPTSPSRAVFTTALGLAATLLAPSPPPATTHSIGRGKPFVVVVAREPSGDVIRALAAHSKGAFPSLALPRPFLFFLPPAEACLRVSLPRFPGPCTSTMHLSSLNALLSTFSSSQTLFWQSSPDLVVAAAFSEHLLTVSQSHPETTERVSTFPSPVKPCTALPAIFWSCTGDSLVAAGLVAVLTSLAHREQVRQPRRELTARPLWPFPPSPEPSALH